MYQPSAYRALMISPYYLMVQSVKSRNDIPMKSPADFWCSAARVKAVTKEQRNPPEHPARLRSPLSKTWGFKLFLGGTSKVRVQEGFQNSKTHGCLLQAMRKIPGLAAGLRRNFRSLSPKPDKLLNRSNWCWVTHVYQLFLPFRKK